uniref:Transcription factor E2F7 n=1 Tax=Amphiprion percula TaxID=161767 RepID=A0A3P8U2P9_AMPPE
QMEAECLALKDLSSPRKHFTVEPDEDGGQSEQKENMFTERRRSTPLKSAESAMPALLINRKGATPDLAHITPIKHTALTEPWTPTANLKMLISAASPDIRDREMKKVLFRPIENDKDKPFDTVDGEDGEKKPSRKQKSLGLLCQKFLALYPDYPPPHSPIWISLDEVANSLGVERRRIYDIVNVLESLTIVGRIAKNSYTWYGRQRLEATLEELQRRGRQQGYHLQMELTIEAGGIGVGREDDGGEGEAGNGNKCIKSGCNRKDKSLRIMSQKFVMLFLVSKTQTVTLDAAAKILIEESQDSSSHSKYKTKVRRLYDIANVLTSLGLIKKVHVREERGRKPAFKWLGPVKFNSSGNPVTGQDLRKAKMARHASFNITPTSVAIQRQVSSAPSSPRRELTGKRHSQVLNLNAVHVIVCSVKQKIVKMKSTAPLTRPPLLSYPGLNNLNFLLSAGQQPASLTLPPSGVPTLALPYVLVPSAALSHYPLVTSSLQQQGSDAHTKLSFSLPAMMSPAHFMVGPAPYSVAAAASDLSRSPVPLPSTPEQSRLYVSAASTKQCSQNLHYCLVLSSQTPHTPKEATVSSSKAFFQTPGTLGNVVSAAPAARKRGSAQRRLDIGHPPAT